VGRFFDLSEGLEYERSKVILVVNHASKKVSISVKKIEETLKWPATVVIPEDAIAYSAADQGIPLIRPDWQKRPIVRAINRLSNHLVGELGMAGKTTKAEESNGSPAIARLFNR
jgi:Flp pilus assembly CpaE family ATPase